MNLNPTQKIDLHAHTTASDGTSRPRELVALAAKAGLAAIAVTDHDTIDGLAEAMEAGRELGVTVIPGVEISLDFKGPKVNGRSGWMHLLVYNILPAGALAGELAELQAWRVARNGRIIAKLNELGLAITLAEVAEEAVEGQIGRPHFAQVLLKRGYVKTLQQAFDDYLAKGAPAYEDKRRLTPKDALALAGKEDAIAVLAHPFSLGLDDQSLEKHLVEWKNLGLKGIEVIYPEHDLSYRARLLQMATRLDLIVTGGTDFHGANKPDILLGSGINDNVVVAGSYLNRLR